jgi:hypothetical protein
MDRHAARTVPSPPTAGGDRVRVEPMPGRITDLIVTAGGVPRCAAPMATHRGRS